MNDIALPRRSKAIRLVGVASGHGADDPRCEAAPYALRAADIAAQLRARGLNAQWAHVVRPTELAAHYARSAVHDVCTQLANSVTQIVEQGELPVVIGGDHTSAIGTWKGIARALRAHGGIGLLWIDAHMDAHTPQTSESGRLHGMPVACLLGRGYPELVGIAEGVRLEPESVCLYGVRSFESGEARLIERLGVRVFFIDEIARRGVRDTLCEAVDIVSRSTAGFGITLDLDAIDPADAPAVNTPAPNGVRATELIDALAQTGGDPRLLGVEIVEYNPFRDSDGRTARIVGDALAAMLLGFASKPNSQSFASRSTSASCAPD